VRINDACAVEINFSDRQEASTVFSVICERCRLNSTSDSSSLFTVLFVVVLRKNE